MLGYTLIWPVTVLFPVFCSLLDPSAVAELITTKYDLRITRCQFWHRGLSDIYLLETERDLYILKVYHYHWRNKEDIYFELEFLTFLKSNGIPVSDPLESQEDGYCIYIEAPEGTRYAALFNYAAGSVALGDLNPQQSHLLGITLAKLHHCSENFRTSHPRQPLNLEYILENSLNDISPFLRERKKELEDFREIINNLKKEIQNLPTNTPYWTVCWGDPHSGNIHFTSDEHLTLFDFDQCGYGYRLFDIAKFWQVTLQSGLSRGIRDTFLTGYQSIQSISELEFLYLKPFTQIAHIWAWSISLNAAKFYDYCRLDDYYFTKRLQHLKRISGNDLYPRL